MALEILPSHLQSIAAALSGQPVSMATVMTAAQAAMEPVPAALDSVSQFASAFTSLYSPIVMDFNVDAVTKLADGAQVLVPVSAEYELIDQDNSGTVTTSAVGIK